MHRYSISQQKALFWVPKIVSFSSICCSLLLLYVLVRDRKTRLQKVFGRLWFSISLGNLGLAIMSFLSTLTAPVDTWYGAIGNEASCVASGATFHYIFAANMVYHGSLGLYYYCSIHTQWNDDYVKRKIEPWVHLTAVLYPTTGVIFGLVYNMYGTSDVFAYCWVAPAPFGCRLGDAGLECTSGDHLRPLFILLSSLIEFNPFTAFKLFSVFTIFFTFSKQKRMMNRKYNTTMSNSLAHETLIQAALFLLAGCIIPYGFSVLLRVVDTFWKDIPNPATDSFFAFSLIAQTLFPLQGVTNIYIYFRPKWKQLRRENPGDTRQAMLIKVLGSPKPPKRARSLKRLSMGLSRFSSAWRRASHFGSTFQGSTTGSTFDASNRSHITGEQTDRDFTEGDATEREEEHSPQCYDTTTIPSGIAEEETDADASSSDLAFAKEMTKSVCELPTESGCIPGESLAGDIHMAFELAERRKLRRIARAQRLKARRAHQVASDTDAIACHTEQVVVEESDEQMEKSSSARSIDAAGEITNVGSQQGV